MRIIFTKHALERMQSRKITYQEVLGVACFPLYTIRRANQIIELMDDSLKVISVKQGKILKIITVYKL